MGAMKQFYTASLEYDRDTGASLCAWPEWRQRDMRADEWEWDTVLDWPDSRPLATESLADQDRSLSIPSQRRESP
jgi:hypothetical protein